MLHQGIGFAELRGAAIGQAVVGTTGAALLGDAVGVSEGQQAAEPARMLGVAHGLGHRPVLEQALELPGQLPRALHAAHGVARGAAFAAEQGQATVQIGAAAAENVALGQQRRQLASQPTEAQRLATQQQMGDTRMARQLGHGLAMGIECTTLVQRTKATE